MALATRASEDIKKDVVDQLYWDDRIDASNVKAEVTNGAVTLTGSDIEVSVRSGWVTLNASVDAYWKKLRAEEIATTLTGVLGVTNELAVVPSDAYEDKLIADNIVSALDRNVHVDAESVDVRVNDGVVTLSGSVSSLPAFVNRASALWRLPPRRLWDNK